MQSLVGHLLVATPNLRDPNFERTVVLLVAHEAQASAFSALRTASADPERDKPANTWCLQLELLHKPLSEQLQLLVGASDFYFLTDLVAVVRSATAAAKPSADPPSKGGIAGTTLEPQRNSS